MFASSPAVHPMDVAAPANPAQQPQPPPGVLMGSLPGMPGTPSGLALRIVQLLFAASSVAVMSSTSDFATVDAFLCLIAVGLLQCVWSLCVAILDIYALLVKRSLRKLWLFTVLATGDTITFLGMLTGASAAAGMTVFIDKDLHICSVNHCPPFQTAVAMGFMTLFCLLPSFGLNVWSVAYYNRVIAA